MVIDMIENHLNKKMNLTMIADAMGYSKYHLHRIFTDMTGLSIHDYVQRRQLTEAAKLLVFSNKSILEISFIAGYESQQAFTNIFKQMYKKTPNEYRIDKEFYPLQLRFNVKYEGDTMMNQAILTGEITHACESDISLWMELVRATIDGYPHLNETDYISILKDCIHDQRAFILKHDAQAAAVMILNYETESIDFFGIHPLYRKGETAQRFLDKAMEELENKTISITTFREGDKADTGYRKTYQNLGFAKAELLVEFGYPTQKFVIKPSSAKKNNE